MHYSFLFQHTEANIPTNKKYFFKLLSFSFYLENVDRGWASLLPPSYPVTLSGKMYSKTHPSTMNSWIPLDSGEASRSKYECVSVWEPHRKGGRLWAPDWQQGRVPPLRFLLPRFLSATTSCPAPHSAVRDARAPRSHGLNRRKRHRALAFGCVWVCKRTPGWSFLRTATNKCECFIGTFFSANMKHWRRTHEHSGCIKSNL